MTLFWRSSFSLNYLFLFILSMHPRDRQIDCFGKMCLSPKLYVQLVFLIQYSSRLFFFYFHIYFYYSNSHALCYDATYDISYIYIMYVHGMLQFQHKIHLVYTKCVLAMNKEPVREGKERKREA